MGRRWVMMGFFVLGCGPSVHLPSGGGSNDGSGGGETGLSPTSPETTETTDDPTSTESTATGSSSGAEVCACGEQVLAELGTVRHHPDGALIQAFVSDSGGLWLREEPLAGGGNTVYFDASGELVDVWPDQQLSLHAPVQLAVSPLGVAAGEFVVVDAVWRLQLFDNTGLRLCYLDREAPLFPTLPPPGGWAFLQPGSSATRLPASCDLDQAEEVSLALVPADLEIEDAVWTSGSLVVLGSRNAAGGRQPFAATLDRADGGLLATASASPPSLAHRWTRTNEGILLTTLDDTAEVFELDPSTGALDPVAQVDAGGVTLAVALPHPTDPWLVLEGDAPRVVRLSEEPCCPPMALDLEGSTLDILDARRTGDTFSLVREYEEDGAIEVAQQRFALE